MLVSAAEFGGEPGSVSASVDSPRINYDQA